jgi:serine/threonine-protein phosphatase 5
MAAVVSEAEALSLSLKDAGNAFLKDGKFASAAEKYTEAIGVHPTAVLYSNRAQAMIKLESYGLAISDADMAIR